jgi:cell division septation protein DedD
MRRNTLFAAAMLAGLVALTGLAGCSREKIDWKSAEAADTVEGYDHFIERHPDSALVTQARTRVAQLNEDRDWKTATAADSAEAYQQFLAQHPGGKWAGEARIRVENFALDGTATGPDRPVVDAASAAAPVKVLEAKSIAQPKPSSTTATPAPRKRLAVATPAAAPSAGGAPTAAATPSDAFGIQLGAFSTRDAALKNWKQLRVKYDADLHGLFAHAVPVKQASGQLFRLQAPVGAEPRARAICASLVKQSQPCVIVLPQH